MDMDGYEGSRGGRGRRRDGGAQEARSARRNTERPIESPLPGTVWRVFDEADAMFLRWRLPEAVLRNPSDKDTVLKAAQTSIGLRHDHLRACLEFRDGSLWLHDIGDSQLSLQKWLDGFSSGRATPDSAFRVVEDLAAALDHVAKQGAVPQHFGPDSVTVLPEGNNGCPAGLLEEFVVADKVRDMLRPPDGKPDEWRAPECRTGRKATAESNQWTLAALLYKMLSGGMPDETKYVPVRQLSAGQNWAFRRALSDNPVRRFKDCTSFALMAKTGKNPGATSRRRAFLAAAILVAGIAAAAWQVMKIRADGVIELPPAGGSLEDLPVQALSPEAEAHLEKALASKKDGKWKECLAAARAVLAEDPEHAQARLLATEAEDELRPWVEIVADKPGAWIVHDGARVRLPTRIRVEPGGRAGPWDVRAEIGGVAWSAFIPEFTVGSDWVGTRRRDVSLQRGEVGAGAERKRRTVVLPGGKTITMVWCPPGTFRMGEKGSGNERTVRLTKGFWLAEAELTVGEWKSVKGRSPSSLAKWNNSFKQPPIADINARPLENVSWEEAASFADELNASGCELDLRFRLPTEAEWEYACRAGTDGDFAGPLEDLAWFEKTAMTVRVVDTNTRVTVGELVAPQPPKGKRPNAWGFFDMHGNVAEWCADFWTERPWTGMAKTGATDDPAVLSGGGRGEGHVVRGGDTTSYAAACASHARRGVAKPQEGQRDGFAGVMDAISKMQGGDGRRYANIGLRLAADEE
jgi:formylglycine-generating enzyme required for sulfatase activity